MKKNDKLKYAIENEMAVSERAISVTLIRRLKARGDTKFTKIINKDMQSGNYLKFGKKDIDKEAIKTENGAFREAIRTGPFIDTIFRPFKNHGAYAHMIERDILYRPLQKPLNNNHKKFYDYLGSKKGITFWADLFDSGSTTGTRSYTRPENVTGDIREYLLD